MFKVDGKGERKMNQNETKEIFVTGKSEASDVLNSQVMRMTLGRRKWPTGVINSEFFFLFERFIFRGK